MNPYETPVDDRPGEYDRSLMKRIAFAVLLLAVWVAGFSAMIFWQQYEALRYAPESGSMWDVFIAFFWDWKANNIGT